MNILIIGGGQLGRKTAELLDAAGHEVALLSDSADNLSLLSPDFEGVATLGVPMDVNSLREAGIEGCDAVAVVTADDNMNITVGQIARDYFGVPKVVARITDPSRETVFENFGLDSICPTNLAGDKLVSALTAPQQSRQVNFGITTASLTVRPLDRRLPGLTTDDLELPPGEGLFGVIRVDGRFVLMPHRGRITLEPGDALVVSTTID